MIRIRLEASKLVRLNRSVRLRSPLVAPPSRKIQPGAPQKLHEIGTMII